MLPNEKESFSNLLVSSPTAGSRLNPPPGTNKVTPASSLLPLVDEIFGDDRINGPLSL
jgi:hypothetical protein